MELIELLSIAVSFAFALGISWCLVAPFFSKEEVFLGEGSEVVAKETLIRRKEMLLESLEDLDAEWQAGKMLDEQYERTKAELQQRTSECIAQLDALHQSSLDSPTSNSDVPPTAVAEKPDGDTNGTSQAA